MEKCYRKGGRENRDIVERVKRKIQLPFRNVGCHWLTGIWSERKPSRHRKFALFYQSLLFLHSWSFFPLFENVLIKYIIWNDEWSLFKKKNTKKDEQFFLFPEFIKKNTYIYIKRLKFVDIIKNFPVLILVFQLHRKNN